LAFALKTKEFGRDAHVNVAWQGRENVNTVTPPMAPFPQSSAQPIFAAGDNARAVFRWNHPPTAQKVRSRDSISSVSPASSAPIKSSQVIVVVDFSGIIV
jgi:hypothetical protein